jgi:L-fuculose-phosphate aldolase
MEDRGLTIGTSGNVSVRVSEGAIISPSSVPYREITPADTVLLDLDGNVLPDDGVNERYQSVEHKVHLAVYKARPEIGAVVHAHPTAASAFAAARVELPAFLDEFGVYVGDAVRVADYAISGTEDIANNAAKAMGETANAVFLASHGMVGCGKTMADAMLVVREVERAALVYVYASLLGGPKELPEDAKNLVAAVFAYKRTAG